MALVAALVAGAVTAVGELMSTVGPEAGAYSVFADSQSRDGAVASAPLGPNSAYTAPGGHGEVDAAQDRLIAVRLRDPADLDGYCLVGHAHSVWG